METSAATVISSYSTGAEERGSSRACFSLGQLFGSFEASDLQTQLKAYERENFVQFWCRYSRTIQAAQKKVNRPLCERLRYYEVSYRCIHGGKKFSEGKRATS